MARLESTYIPLAPFQYFSTHAKSPEPQPSQSSKEAIISPTPAHRFQTPRISFRLAALQPKSQKELGVYTGTRSGTFYYCIRPEMRSSVPHNQSARQKAW